MRWKTFSNPTLPPSPSANSFHPSLHPCSINPNDGRTPIDDSTNPESYALLCSQLRSAAEKRAAQLSKGVMNDLERRLLQRQHSGWFETFLVAMVLLNCVERASWLFWTWENEQYYSKVKNAENPPEFSHSSVIEPLTHLSSGRSTDDRLIISARARTSLISSICFSKCVDYHRKLR